MRNQAVKIGSLAILLLASIVPVEASIIPVVLDYTPFTIDPFNGAAVNAIPATSGTFSGSASGTTVGLVTLSGTFTSTSVLRAYNQGLTFSNPDYPAFSGFLPAIAVNGNDAPAGSNPYASFVLTFSQPLPTGSFLVVSDVDAATSGEYATIWGLSSTAYLGMIRSDTSGPVANPPIITYNTVDGSWHVQSTGANPAELSFFDVSGLTTLTYRGGFVNAAQVGVGTVSGIEFLLPTAEVPEPGSITLVACASLLTALYRVRKQAGKSN